MHGRAHTLGLLAVLAVILPMLFLLSRARRGPEVAAHEMSTSGEIGSGPLDPASGLDGPTARDPVATESLAAGSEQERLEIDGGFGTLTVSGRVVEGGTEEPVAGATVTLDAPDDYVQTETDETGRFFVDLRADAWEMGASYRAVVSRPGNQRLFLGNVVLEPELLIRARTHVVLRGKLVTNRRILGAVSVQAHVPPTGTVHVAVYAGVAELDREYRFELPCWVDRVPDSFQLAFGAMGGRFLVLEVPSAELTSDEGATIDWRAGDLTLRVVEPGGRPIPEARVRVAADGDGPEAAVQEGKASETGEVSFFVHRGTAQICASADGFTYVRRAFPVGTTSVEEEIVLRRLGPEELLVGRVVDAQDEPVEGAFVSALPDGTNAEVDVAGMVGMRTEADGVFRLAIARDAPLRVGAFHSDRGRAQDVFVTPGIREVVLRFAPAGSVRVELVGVPSDQGSWSGGVQWILVAEGSGRTFSSHDWGTPFRIEDLPEGSYDLHVLLRKNRLMGHGTVTIQRDEEQVVTLAVERVPWAEGTLLLFDGRPAAGLHVRLVESEHPSEVMKRWCRAKTGPAGSFQFPLGSSGKGVALVQDDGDDELGRLELTAGPGEYRLP